MKIQVLLATYNGDKYLEEFLESLLKQTYNHFELLVQDDCSLDNTVKILNKYSCVFKEMKICKNNRNLGYYNNFHELLKQADGDIVFLADQDDVWIPEKIQRAIDILLKNDEVILYYSELDLHNQDMEPLDISLSRCLKFNPMMNSTKYLLARNVVTGCTTAFKNGKLREKLIPFPFGLKYHDWWIALCASMKGKLYFDRRSTVFYRQHGKNSIGINALKYNPGIRQRLKDYIVDLELKNRMILELKNRFYENDFRKDIKEIELNKKEKFIIKVSRFYKIIN